MKCPGLIVFPLAEQRAVNSHLMRRIYIRKQPRPQVQLVLLVSGNIGGWVVVGIAIAVKTQCSIRLMYRVLFHGFKKDLRPGFYQACVWLPPFGKHPLASTRGRRSSRPAFWGLHSTVVEVSRKRWYRVQRNCRKGFYLPFCMNLLYLLSISNQV